jgi:hypothetical protein
VPEVPFVQEVLAQTLWCHLCLTQGGHDYPVPAGLECPVSALQCQRPSKHQHFFVSLLVPSPGQYWQIGKEILERQEKEGWGTKVIDRLSADLHAAFPQ